MVEHSKAEEKKKPKVEDTDLVRVHFVTHHRCLGDPSREEITIELKDD